MNFIYWHWTCYVSIISHFNHFYKAEKHSYVIKCIRNGWIMYWKPVRVYSEWSLVSQLKIQDFRSKDAVVIDPTSSSIIFYLKLLFWPNFLCLDEETRATELFPTLELSIAGKDHHHCCERQNSCRTVRHFPWSTFADAEDEILVR